MLCGLRGEKGGDKLWDSAREQEEAEAVQSSWEEPSLREEMLLLVLGFLDKRFLSI